MKFILFTLTALLATLLQGCATTVSTASSEEDGRPMITHSVYGMDCPGCHGGLEKNLEKIPGVADAAANWKQQTVTLYLASSDSVTYDQIKQAVENSNFTLGEVVP